MSTPHTCPTCEGKRTVEDEYGKLVEAGCPTCEGTGVVWEPDGPQEARTDGGDDPLDLSYRR